MSNFKLTSDFSNEYRNHHNEKVMKLMIALFAFHIPVAGILSYFYKTSYFINIGLAALVTVTSILTYFFMKRSNLLYVVFGVNAIVTSAMVIYAGRGLPEMHYHFFVIMSLMIAFAQPLAVISAVLAVSVHHLGTYFLAPGSGFPVEYPLELFALHFVAAVFQALPCILISKHGEFIVDTQGKLLVDLKGVAMSNEETSQSLDSSMKVISSNTLKQNESMTQASSAVTEIEGMMKRNQENINQTHAGTKKAFELLNQTREKITIVKTTMESLSTDNDEAVSQLNEGARELTEMVELMEKVASRSKIINDIVFQTKLLSFNASVESARAGEMGKGFAVVAEEVGNLAASSGQAALEINELVEEARNKINTTSESLHEKIEFLSTQSSTGISKGLSLVSEGDVYINQTVSHVDKINQSSSDIQEASGELLEGVSRINESLNLLSDTIESTSQLTKDTLNLSNEVSESSASLNELLKQAS